MLSTPDRQWTDEELLALPNVSKRQVGVLRQFGAIPVQEANAETVVPESRDDADEPRDPPLAPSEL